MIEPAGSAVDVMSIESEDLFFSLLRKLQAKCYSGIFETLIMVVSSTVVVAIWLNILWHMSQKCGLSKIEYKSRWMYVCMCLCGYLCSYEGLLSGKYPQKTYMWKDTGAALSLSHHIVIF